MVFSWIYFFEKWRIDQWYTIYTLYSLNSHQFLLWLVLHTIITNDQTKKIAVVADMALENKNT